MAQEKDRIKISMRQMLEFVREVPILTLAVNKTSYTTLNTIWLVTYWMCIDDEVYKQQKIGFCHERTILVAGGGAAWANMRAAAVKSLPVSVCLRGVRLLFAWLAWKLLLLLFDLLRRLPMSHGDLLLVQCQGMGGQHCLATPTPLNALHGGLWHLRA